MTSYCEAGVRLSKKTGIDKIHPEMLYSEIKRCEIQVFQRLAVIVQFLSERNLAFKVSVERIREPSNGNCLCLIELLAKFDPVMGEHLRRVTNAEIHDHYQGKGIQTYTQYCSS